MLRWKKLKVKTATEDAVNRPATLVSDASGEYSTSDVVLENVPHSISVGRNVAPTSSNSSVSSDGLHIMQPLTRFSDDETTVSGGIRRAPCHSRTQDSPHESCTSVRANGATTGNNVIMQSTAGQKRKLELFSRKVSDSDLSVPSDDTASGDEAAPVVQPKKKAPMSPTSVSLLANSEDSEILNPLHVFVRNQIEVFTATPKDMALPAPGRKNPIKLHQVGLRCIHCSHLPSRDRVKRAVCYPSSVGRVYHSVSDMKFDHFGNCRGISQELRDELESLKTQCKRRGDKQKSGNNGNSSSTAQYYHDAARKMGMVDGGGGIFMAKAMESRQFSPTTRLAAPVDHAHSLRSTSSLQASLSANASKQLARRASFHSLPPLPAHVLAMYQQMPKYACVGLSKPASKAAPPPLVYPLLNASQSRDMSRPVLSSPFTPRSRNMLLSSPLDQQFLNPIHCFVRRNVEVFAATEEDIAAPAPGRKKRVTIGQVGIRCIHCALLPTKDRVKRAVCYPPSVNGIYHSVSNMKFDHFGSCKGLPAEARAEFASLKASCKTRSGSGSGASRGGMSNSTAQYYNDSAFRLGLVDTEEGIRFRDQRLTSESGKTASTISAPAASIPGGISALMLAATNPLIRAEYDRRKKVSDEVLNI